MNDVDITGNQLGMDNTIPDTASFHMMTCDLVLRGVPENAGRPVSLIMFDILGSSGSSISDRHLGQPGGRVSYLTPNPVF
jgi:hypothetical protein